MSETISSEIDAQTALLKGDFEALQAGVKHLLDGMTTGSTVTQAQVDALAAVHASFASLAASLPPAAPEPTPEPAPEPTP